MADSKSTNLLVSKDGWRPPVDTPLKVSEVPKGKFCSEGDNVVYLRVDDKDNKPQFAVAGIKDNELVAMQGKLLVMDPNTEMYPRPDIKLTSDSDIKLP